MLELRSMARRVPGLRAANRAYIAARFKCQGYLLRRSPVEEVFTEIFHAKKWNGKESVSGSGSSLDKTTGVRTQFPAVCRNFGIHTMLDIPCGDFHWMRHVDFDNIDYTGADIVSELVKHNSQYETSNIHFCKLNLINDRLPNVDMVLCRDCLVHFSLKDVLTALHNICDSGSRYLWTTTFTSPRQNRDIATGQWRPLNLEASPFLFPAPLLTINEGCIDAGGIYGDKSLGLWRIEDIAECLTTRFN
jgi:hypothetical protein